MTDSTQAAPGRIFVNYRREETAYAAGWLYGRLAERFGGAQIFKDVDTIQPGDDFVAKVNYAVGSCQVLLALIGDRWLTITGADGRRRLDDPEDFVRVEIEAALARNILVVPILVAGAKMPTAGDLPPSIAGLVRRQALELSPNRFDTDLSRLLKVLSSTLATKAPKAPEQGEQAGRSDPRRSMTASYRPAKSAPVRRKTNSRAIAAIICAVVSLIFPLAAVGAIVFGHVARREIRRSGEAGARLATTGIVVGWIWLLVVLIALTLAVVPRVVGP